MPTPTARQKLFRVTNPDGLLSRRDAVNLIHRHADKVRDFESSELSDAQIEAELPKAWQREHDQADLFRDAPLEPANDEFHPKSEKAFWARKFELFRSIWNRLR
jgi:hypothetical protein